MRSIIAEVFDGVIGGEISEKDIKRRKKYAKIALKVLREELKVRELQLKMAQAEAEIRKLEAE